MISHWVKIRIRRLVKNLNQTCLWQTFPVLTKKSGFSNSQILILGPLSKTCTHRNNTIELARDYHICRNQNSARKEELVVISKYGGTDCQEVSVDWLMEADWHHHHHHLFIEDHVSVNLTFIEIKEAKNNNLVANQQQ